MCWPVSCRWNTFSISTRIPGDQSEQLFVEMFQLWLEISLWTSWPQLRHSSSIAQTVWPSRVYQSKFSTLKVSQHMSEIRLFWTQVGIMQKFFHSRLFLKNTTIQRWIITRSPADADKAARRKRMQKLLQFDVFRFNSPNSISPNFKLPMHSFRRYV